MDAVEVDRTSDVARVRHAGVEGQLAAHAETQGTHLHRGDVRPAQEIVGGPPEIGSGSVDVEGHEELGGGIWTLGGFAGIEVGRESHEAGRGEAIGHRFDMVHEPPPLLNYQQSGPVPEALVAK